jgi:TorA maturation chaperone TorD
MPTPFEPSPGCESPVQTHVIAEEASVEFARDLACETLFRFLAAAFSNPTSAEWQVLGEGASQAAARASQYLLSQEFDQCSIPLGFGELPLEDLDLRPLLSELPVEEDLAVIEHGRVFGLAGTRECSPYETEYHPNEEVFFRSQQMADIAGFYRAFGLNVSPARHERVDHIALELEFAAFMLMKKRLARSCQAGSQDGELPAVVQEARRHFLRDHLSWWAPSFTVAVRRKSAGGFYAAVGAVLAALLPIERQRLGIVAPKMPLEARSAEPEPHEQASSCEGCALAHG